MPFDLDEACRDFCRNSTVKRIFSNPLIVAFIITIIIALITYFLFYDVEEDEVWKKVAKSGVYNLGIITAMTLIHYKVLEEDFGKATRNETRDEVMRVVGQTDALTPERLARVDNAIPKTEPVSK